MLNALTLVHSQKVFCLETRKIASSARSAWRKRGQVVLYALLGLLGDTAYAQNSYEHPSYRGVQAPYSQPMGQFHPQHEVYTAQGAAPVRPPASNGTSPHDPRNRVTVTNEPIMTLPMYHALPTYDPSSAGSYGSYRYPRQSVPGAWVSDGMMSGRTASPYPQHPSAVYAPARPKPKIRPQTGVIVPLPKAPAPANIGPADSAAHSGQPSHTQTVALPPRSGLSLSALAAGEGANRAMQDFNRNVATQEVPVVPQIASAPEEIAPTTIPAKTILAADIAKREKGYAPHDLPYIRPSEGWRLDIGGQLNQAIVHGRSSGTKDTFLADNSHDPSFALLRASRAFKEGYIVGGQLQGGVRFNPTDRVYIDDSDMGNNIYLDLMRAEAFVAHEKYGRFWLGHGSMATDGMTGVDLSGTDVVTGADMEAIGAGFTQDLSVTGNKGTTGREVFFGESYHAYNGLGKEWRARYDSPNVRGFNVSAGTTVKGDPDLALRWSGAFSKTRFKAAVGVATGVNTPKEADNTNWGLSFSTLFPWGSNITFAYGTTDPVRAVSNNTSQTEFFYYGKIGQQFRLFNFGTTAFSVDYGFAATHRRASEDIEKYGVALVQKIDPINMDVYLSFHTADLDEDDSRSEVNETQTLVFGTKVNF